MSVWTVQLRSWRCLFTFSWNKIYRQIPDSVVLQGKWSYMDYPGCGATQSLQSTESGCLSQSHAENMQTPHWKTGAQNLPAGTGTTAPASWPAGTFIQNIFAHMLVSWWEQYCKVVTGKVDYLNIMQRTSPKGCWDFGSICDDWHQTWNQLFGCRS